MTEDQLKSRILSLEKDIERKSREVDESLDKIDILEETVMRLEALIPEEDNNKKKKRRKQGSDSKLAIELNDRENQIRELKNKMGYLRKDKVQVQQELEKLKLMTRDSGVIRIPEKPKSPLNALAKDLQEKVNKQRSLINKMRADLAKSDKISEKLKIKDKEIEILTLEIIELTQKLEDLSVNAKSKQDNTITSRLIEDLQNQLNKAKGQIINLKKKSTFVKELKRDQVSEIELLTKELNELKKLLGNKDDEIKKLKDKVETLQKAEIAANFEVSEAPPETIIKNLKEDLQNKLNKAKVKIRSLQEQLKKHEISTAGKLGKSQNELDRNLEMQRETVDLLQKQIKTKEGEIQTIKNEAVQIKKRYRQLENQLKQKDHKLNEVQVQYDKIATSNIQTSSQTKKELDPHISLRIKELMNINDEIKKDNMEQRIELSHLRKKS